MTWITEFCGTSLNGGISTYDKELHFLTLVPALSTRLELCVYGPHWLWKIRSDKAIAYYYLSKPEKQANYHNLSILPIILPNILFSETPLLVKINFSWRN